GAGPALRGRGRAASGGEARELARGLEPQERGTRRETDRFVGAGERQPGLCERGRGAPRSFRKTNGRPRVAVVEPLRRERIEDPRFFRIARERALERGAPAVRVSILVARQAELDLRIAGGSVGSALLRMEREPLALVVLPAPA